MGKFFAGWQQNFISENQASAAPGRIRESYWPTRLFGPTSNNRLAAGFGPFLPALVNF